MSTSFYRIRMGLHPDRVVDIPGDFIILPREAVGADLYVASINPAMDLGEGIRVGRLTDESVHVLAPLAKALYASARQQGGVQLSMDPRLPSPVRNYIAHTPTQNAAFGDFAMRVEYGPGGLSIDLPAHVVLVGNSERDGDIGETIADCQRILLGTQLIGHPEYRGLPEDRVEAIERHRLLRLAQKLGSENGGDF
ncbi:MAG: hypothetical protein HY520_05085 [Candidatus Aenigmarchaeota archaeon]|nr:hypothetical protein [Candidatus Aenigmarchaeota archaeon]